MSSLDPVFTVGQQMIETLRAHDKTVSKSQAQETSADMLREVRISNPERVLRQYPFELSGGMCQRVMIAIALLRGPKLLIADEPTTALDVTTQIQILQILKDLQRRNGMAIIFITHSLSLVAELCDTAAVMCGGFIMERGTTDDIFYRAAHPYTRMLHQAVPRIDMPVKEPFATINVAPDDPFSTRDGCIFQPRCPVCTDQCMREMPSEATIAPGHSVRCHKIVDGGIG